MGNLVTTLVKHAPNGVARFKNGKMIEVPAAFKRLFDPSIGTELQHTQSGIRIFQKNQTPTTVTEWVGASGGALNRQTTVIHEAPGATVISPQGKYFGITNQEFKNLLNVTADELTDSQIWKNILKKLS